MITQAFRDAFFKSAICHRGDGFISVEDLDIAICNGPLAYSGTSVALYKMKTETTPLLLKIFSRNWTRHTRDFCDWAYGHELQSVDIFALANSLAPYIQRLRTYGLDVVVPLSVWEIPDPFQVSMNERALAIIVREYSDPSIRKMLFDLRNKNDKDHIARIFRNHINLLLHVILAAEELGDVSEYVIRYGVDLKDRNLILAQQWMYVDLFPVLTPNELVGYRKRAPTKAFMKRFDTRYYIYDLLLRYYKIVPDMIYMLIGIAHEHIAKLDTKAEEYSNFLSQYMNAYIVKWGHMPPDTDWQHPFDH